MQEYTMSIMIAVLMLAQVDLDQVNLTCTGGGTAKKASSEQVYGVTSDGQTTTSNVTHFRKEDYTDQVDVRINMKAAEGQIRLPGAALPSWHGGDKGWFKLKGLSVTDDTMTAKVTLNMLNSASIYIDRHTGSISIFGPSGHYAGQCDRADTSMPRRF
jgi:hypothetical protein